KTLRLRSRITAQEFYQRLGFSTEGETFDYLNVPHVVMNLSLPVLGV
ncbi:MAG: GNAT family N-acetyltransferase, partial [Symploca sp. SIO1B1]|nr:GNAT family N-acetyltransferase [Symploca sp. SIO1B1]